MKFALDLLDGFTLQMDCKNIEQCKKFIMFVQGYNARANEGEKEIFVNFIVYDCDSVYNSLTKSFAPTKGELNSSDFWKDIFLKNQGVNCHKVISIF